MIILYDDAVARTFEPFATSRPLGEVRAGALLGRERWARWFGDEVRAHVSAAHLAGFVEFDAPAALRGDVPAGAWLVNSRALPALQFNNHTAAMRAVTAPAETLAAQVRINGRVAAVRVKDALALSRLASGVVVLEDIVPANASVCDVDGAWLNDPWDIIRHLVSQLQQDIPALAAALRCERLSAVSIATGAQILGDAPVYLEAGARVEPFTLFDTTAGPVLVRRDATVQAFTRIVGPCCIGVASTVMGDRIAASSIGEHCRVHGELSTSVFIGHANKGHDGFVGHSLLGRWVNLGAGTITSNLKNTYGSVAMWSPSGVRDTGLQFAGTFFGDHAKTGIGLRLTTGCVVGTGANAMDAMPPKAVAPFSWGAGAPYSVFARDKFLSTAERMMARRQVVLDDAQRAHWNAVYEYAMHDTRWPSR